jgi:excisionase family DNA binding protein
MQEKHDMLKPKYGPLNTWQQISGVGRSKTYEMLETGELRGIKVGRRLLIDIEAGLAALAAMPPARVGRGEAAGL